MRATLALVAAVLAGICISVAGAGNSKITLYATPNPASVGAGFDIYLCGEGGRYIYLEVVAPDGSEQSTEIGTNTLGCAYPIMHAAAPVAGDYQVLACKWSTNTYECVGNSRLLASATETVS